MSSKKKPCTKAAEQPKDSPTEAKTDGQVSGASVNETYDLFINSELKHVGFRLIAAKLPDLPISENGKLFAMVECSFGQYCTTTTLVGSPIVVSVCLDGNRIVFAAKDLVLHYNPRITDCRPIAYVMMTVTDVLPQKS